MSQNKQTVERYMGAFARTDHAAVLATLTDDVEWVIPGMFHVAGKPAFDAAIENDAFAGSPAITVTRLTEEADVVVAEGRVQATKRDGSAFAVEFCDVFEMHAGRIRRLVSYLVEVKPP